MIRIITDSAADLTAQDLAHPGVYVVSMAITFEDGSSIEDNGQMTKDEFFQRLASDSKLPRTSQPSPAAFIEAYADAELDGDEVIVITVGQKLSGTYQCAVMAANDVDTPVYVVDSETATMRTRFLKRSSTSTICWAERPISRRRSASRRMTASPWVAVSESTT